MNYEKTINILFFILISLLIVINSTSAWIGGEGDATCNTIFCNLTGDIGYPYLNLDFANTSGMSDGIDNTIVPGENINVSLLNVTGQIIFSGLTNCNTFDSDSEGVVSCGTDETVSGGDYNFANNFTSDFTKYNGITNLNTSWVIAIGSIYNYENFTIDYVARTGRFKSENMTIAYPNLDLDVTDDFNWINNMSIFLDNDTIIRNWNITGWDLSSADDYNSGNFTTDYVARTGRWKLENLTAVLDNGTLIRADNTSWLNNEINDLWVNESGDTMTGNLNLSLNNLTNVNYYFFDNEMHWLTRDASSVFSGNDDIAKHTIWLHHNMEHQAGTVVFLVSLLNTTVIAAQSGRNNSMGLLGNSWGVMPNNLSMNLSVMTDCVEIGKIKGKVLRVGCDSYETGADLVVDDDIQLFGKTFIGDGIFSEGDVDFIMNGFDVDVFNGSLHVRTPRTEEIGVSIGESFDAFDEDFNDGSISPFVKVAQVGTDVNNWLTVEDMECFDDECARAHGGSGNAFRIMETNTSTFQAYPCNISFIYTSEGLTSARVFNVTLNNNTGSEEQTLFSTTSNSVDTIVNAEINKSWTNVSILTLRYRLHGNANSKVWVDDVKIRCNSSISTEQNVTRLDTEFLFGDGSQRMFWNGSISMLEFPENVSFVNIVENTLNVTETIETKNLTVTDTADINTLILQNYPAYFWQLLNFTNAYIARVGRYKSENFTDDYVTRTGRFKIENMTVAYPNLDLDVTDDWNYVNNASVYYLGITEGIVGNVSGANDSMILYVEAANISMKDYVDTVAANQPLASDYNDGNFTTDYVARIGRYKTENFTTDYVARTGRFKSENMTVAYPNLDLDVTDDWNYANNASVYYLGITDGIIGNVSGANDSMILYVEAANISMKDYVDTVAANQPLGSDYNDGNFTTDYVARTGRFKSENITLVYPSLDLDVADDWNYANNASVYYLGITDGIIGNVSGANDSMILYVELANISMKDYVDTVAANQPLGSDYNYANNFTLDFTKHNGLINTNTSWITANQLITGNTTQEIIDSINLSRVTVNCSNMMFADGSIGSATICDGSDDGAGSFTYSNHFDQFLNTTSNVTVSNLNTTKDIMIKGQLRIVPGGDFTNPDITFVGDSGTGFYQADFGNIGVSLNGDIVAFFEGSGFHVVKRGSQTAPSITMDSETTTGLFWPASTSDDVMGITAGTVEMITFNETSGQDEVIINQDSVDLDFRIETNANEAALFVEGSSGNVNISGRAILYNQTIGDWQTYQDESGNLITKRR